MSTTQTAIDPTPRRAVAAFADYTDALRTAEYLSDNGIPPGRVRIVGQGVRTAEQVAATMSIGRAGLLGAIQGAVIGALFGLLMGLTLGYEPDVTLPLLFLYGLFWGAILGGILGTLLYAGIGVRWTPAPLPGLAAERYEIVVDADVAAQAEQLLRQDTA
jgi:Heat induced stress protein YflT domain